MASFCWLYLCRRGKGADPWHFSISWSPLILSTCTGEMKSNFGFGFIPILSEKVELWEKQIIMEIRSIHFFQPESRYLVSESESVSRV